MEQFPIGITLLLIVSVIIYFGLAQRALDRMRLTDKQAIIVIAAIIVGSYINIPLPFIPFNTSINVGGALVPVGLAIYLLSKAGTDKEWGRALIGAGITAVAVYVVGSLINSGTTMEPAGRYAILDAIYLYPLAGGLIAYILGRSRRAAFISATLGVLLVDIYHYIWLLYNNAPANYTVMIGGGGAFDAIILAGIVAILLAEFIGESFERLIGGPTSVGRPESLIEGLKEPGIEQRNEREDVNTNEKQK